MTAIFYVFMYIGTFLILLSLETKYKCFFLILKNHLG